jgi:hypothetical protein
MVTENEDVPQGIANGMACKFRKLVLKQGAELEKIKMYDYWAHAAGTDTIKTLKSNGRIASILLANSN